MSTTFSSGSSISARPLTFSIILILMDALEVLLLDCGDSLIILELSLIIYALSRVEYNDLHSQMLHLVGLDFLPRRLRIGV